MTLLRACRPSPCFVNRLVFISFIERGEFINKTMKILVILAAVIVTVWAMPLRCPELTRVVWPNSTQSIQFNPPTDNYEQWLFLVRHLPGQKCVPEIRIDPATSSITLPTPCCP